MSTDDNIVKITREVAEHYISLMLKTEIVLTIEKWNNLVEIMEDGCREVLNDVSHDIFSEMQKDKIDFTRN